MWRHRCLKLGSSLKDSFLRNTKSCAQNTQGYVLLQSLARAKKITRRSMTALVTHVAAMLSLVCGNSMAHWVTAVEQCLVGFPTTKNISDAAEALVGTRS